MAAEQPASLDIIVEDNDPRVTYGPDGAWDVSTDRNIIAFGATYHLTSVRGAWALFTFTGSRIWYFADKSDSHDLFGVSLDGGPLELFSSYNSALLTGQLLYYAELSPGTHTINLTNIDEDKYTGIDRFIFRPLELDGSSSSSSGMQAPTQVPRRQDPSVPAGVYAGVGLSAAAVALLVALTGGVLWSRHKQRPRRHESAVVLEMDQWHYSPPTAKPGQGAEAARWSTARAGEDVPPRFSTDYPPTESGA